MKRYASPVSICLLLCLLGAWPIAATGQTLQLKSTTYARGFARPGANDVTNHLPFVEMIQLKTDHLGVSGLSLDVSVWGQAQALDLLPRDDYITGDVTRLVLHYRAPVKSFFEGLQLHLGRQFVAAGPALFEQLDGGYASYRHASGFEAHVFGGAPTGIRFVRQPWALDNDDDTFGGNWVVGGRVGYNYKGWAGVGASYRQKRYDGRLAFNEIGGDVMIFAHQRVTLLADALMEMTVARLKDARALLRIDLPFSIDVSAGYRHIRPDLYVPRTSIFAVFSNERRSEAFGEAHWSPRRWLDVNLEVAGVFYGVACTAEEERSGSCADDADSAVNVDGRINFRGARENPYRVTLQAQRIGAPRGGFWRWRVGAGSPRLWQRLSLIVDFDAAFFDEGQRGAYYVVSDSRTRWAFSGSAFADIVLHRQLSLMVGGGGQVTPLLSSAGNFLVRLTYVFSSPEPPAGPVHVTRSSQAQLAMMTGRR